MKEKIYEEVGTNYRFFLSWRHASFAGDLVIFYTILSLTLSVYEKYPKIAWIIPFVSCPIGVLLWIIDKRSRDIYHDAIKAGEKLEGNDDGFFSFHSKSVLSKGESPFSKLTHSMALNLLFWGTSIILFIISVILLVQTNT